MWQSKYKFILTIMDDGRKVVHEEDVADFSPCYEDLLFTAVFTGKVENDGTTHRAIIEPVWRDGEPARVGGITMSLPQLSKRYGSAIFAQRVWEVLLQRDFLKDEGDRDGEKLTFTWQVEAKPSQAEKKSRLSISLSRRPFPLTDPSLAPIRAARFPRQNNSLSLFLSRQLLQELKEETANSLNQERADILTGHLVQEINRHATVVITGRIPALTETTSSRNHFSFSPLTFFDAQKTIVRRRKSETILGWHHNHPPPCGETCLQIIPACKTRTVFFSTADRSVHRASFAAPYMIALVSGKEAEQSAVEPTIKAYGWQDGFIEEKEFSVF
jgi:hypothetical protein